MRLVIFWSSAMAHCGPHLTRLLDALPARPECILLGSRTGPALQIEAWSEAHDVPVERYQPQYDLHGDMAITVRNGQMLGNASVLLLLWTGRDEQCEEILALAHESGVRALQYNPFSEHEKRGARGATGRSRNV